MKMGIVAYFKALKGVFKLGFEKGLARNRLKQQIKNNAILPTPTLSFDLKGETITVKVIVSDDWILASGLSILPDIPGCGINLEGLIIVNEAFIKESEEFKLVCILHELEHIRRNDHKSMDNVAKPNGKLGKSYLRSDLEVDLAVSVRIGKEAVIDWLKYYSMKMDGLMTGKYNFPKNELFKQRIEVLTAS